MPQAELETAIQGSKLPLNHALVRAAITPCLIQPVAQWMINYPTFFGLYKVIISEVYIKAYKHK